MNRPRKSGLGSRIALLSVTVAVVTALIAGVLAVGLIRQTEIARARSTLSKLADLAQTVADRSLTEKGAETKVRAALTGLNVRLGFVDASGHLRSATPFVTAAVTADDVAAVLRGEDVSTVRSTPSGTVLVEGRPTANGGLFAAQRKMDATAIQSRAIDRILIALLIGAGVATVLGLLYARRLAAPLRRTSAAAHALAAGHRDVSVPIEGAAEIVEVSDAVNRLSRALTASEARQRDFLLGVSHDLRTPLTVLRGYAESFAEGLVPPDETAAVGSVMVGEARRLERLVGDLLDLARLGAHDFRIDPAPTDLAELAAATADAWAQRADAAGVALRADVAAGQLTVVTDAGRVRQVLDGLIENALRVTPAGAAIVVAARREGPSAIVEIRDGGPGLTDDDVSVAFVEGELFRRYRGVREVGTGLGLAIVHRLVSRLGATIEAGRASEGGARFTVRVPIA